MNAFFLLGYALNVANSTYSDPRIPHGSDRWGLSPPLPLSPFISEASLSLSSPDIGPHGDTAHKFGHPGRRSFDGIDPTRSS